MVEHHFEKSRPLQNGQCPRGYHKRKAYTVKKTGTRVPARCVHATTTYKNSSAQYKAKATATQTRRLREKGVKKHNIQCPPGQISRRAYVRAFSPSVKRTGYTRRLKSGKVIQVKPRAKATVVPATCVPDTGLAGKLAPGAKGIGPLRKGELKKHGYVYTGSEVERRTALMYAVKEFGALGTYRKLNAVAKLSVRTRPEAARVFESDRNWVRNTYGLKAF